MKKLAIAGEAAKEYPGGPRNAVEKHLHSKP